MNIKRIIENIQHFWRWHPEVAIRYWPIVKKIKKMDYFGMQKSKIKNLSILEVGSGWLGISPYLGFPVVGLDKDFGDKKFNLLKQFKGNLLKIPFAKNSFDMVISVDVLEHLPAEKRPKALEEIFRVAAKKIFLAIPMGKKSLDQDKQLDRQYKKKFGQPFPFFKEHLKYGFPEEKEMIKLIKLTAEKYKKQIKLEIKGNENLTLREILMKGWMTNNFLIDVLFRKVFLLLLPFFIFFDSSPYYRRIFFVTIKV